MPYEGSNRQRARWTPAFAGVTVFLLLLFSLSTSQDKPNIIIIMADDLGHETIGAYGGESYETPNIDQMAAEGLLFEHGYSNPLCSPTRVKIMTGRYNLNNYTQFAHMEKEEITHGNIMQDAGYKTLITGKWQLSDNDGMHPTAGGYDEFILWQLFREGMGSRYWDPTLDTQEGRQTYPGEFGPDIINDYALDFIERHKDAPFFMYYTMVLPHDPFVDTPDGTGSNGQEKFALMINYMDKMVGNLLQKLKDAGLDSNTLVFFLGDNGTSRSRTSIKNGISIVGGKAHPDDGGTRVPFIARWPGKITAGQTTDQVVDFATFVPTVAEAGGGTLPDNIDGTSIYKNLLDPEHPYKDWIYVWYDPEWGQWEKAVWARDQDYKLYEDGRFFHVPEDVDELNSISVGEGSSEAEEARGFLQQILDNEGHLPGCTDPDYTEFNRQADVDDGSCVTSKVEAQKHWSNDIRWSLQGRELIVQPTGARAEELKVELFDVKGRGVTGAETGNSIRMNLPGASGAVYIMKVERDNRSHSVKVVVK